MHFTQIYTLLRRYKRAKAKEVSYNNIRDKLISFGHTGNYIHIVHEKIIPVPFTVLGCEKYWNVIFFMNDIVNLGKKSTQT